MRKIFGRRGASERDETLDLTVLDGVAATDPDAAELYDDWAERLEQRRRAKLDATDSTTDAAPNHWSPDGVFVGEDTIGELSTAQLLGVLDLTEEADLAEITASYRQKALEHHPDRFAEADDSVRQAHEVAMARINVAYHEVRNRLAP